MKRHNGKRLLSFYLLTKYGLELCQATKFQTLPRVESSSPKVVAQTNFGSSRQFFVSRKSSFFRQSVVHGNVNHISTLRVCSAALLCRGGSQLDIDEDEIISIKRRKSATSASNNILDASEVVTDVEEDEDHTNEESEYEVSEDEDEEETEGEEELYDGEYDSYTEEVDDLEVDDDENTDDDSLVSSMTDKPLQENLQKKSSNLLDVESSDELQYDAPIFMSPMYGVIVQLGVMMLSRRLNMDDPLVIRAARISFIAFNVLMQLFSLYVRFRAKQINDRTPLVINEGLGSLVKNTLLSGDKNSDGATSTSGGGKDMVKMLANQFLASQTTIMEYDVRQSDKMRKSYIFSLILMWILHFKFKQVQPLFLTVASGTLQWIQSPLFQIYVLGRNLKRPFGQSIQEHAAKEAETKEEESEN